MANESLTGQRQHGDFEMSGDTLPHHPRVLSQKLQHDSSSSNHIITTPVNPQHEWTVASSQSPVPLEHSAPSERQRNRCATSILIDEVEEEWSAREASTPMFATPADFMVGYAGQHTLELEAQHRKWRISGVAPHGDICIVCARKRDKYVDRFDCCSLKFCPDCAEYEYGKAVLVEDRCCPLCFKRGWNQMRPYFGSSSPVWELLPVEYKERYMRTCLKVWEIMLRIDPVWRDLHKLKDDGSLVSDRLILHKMNHHSISEYGKKQLAIFEAASSSEKAVLPTSSHSSQGGLSNDDTAQKLDLQYYVRMPMLPLRRFGETMATLEAIIALHESSPPSEATEPAEALARVSSESIRPGEGDLTEQTDARSSVDSITGQASSSIAITTPASSNFSEERLQIQELENTVELQRGSIARLKRTLDAQTCDFDAQKRDFEAHKKTCIIDHVPDIAAFGMELARARGIARGNVKGLETRLQGDRLSKLPVQRLLDNPIFNRRWVQPRKERKQAEDGSGWVVEDVAIKIEDED